MKTLPVRVRRYILFTWVAFFSLLAYFIARFTGNLIADINSVGRIVILISLVVADIIADLFPIIYSVDTSENKAEITLTFSIDFVIAVLYSPLTATLAVFISDMISQIISRKAWYKVFYNSSKIGLQVGITSLFFFTYYQQSSSLFTFRNMTSMFLGFLLYLLLDSMLLFKLLSMINNKQFFVFWFRNIRKILFTTISLFALGLMLIFFLKTEPLMGVFIIPTFIAVYLALRREVEVVKETEQALYALASVVDARIPDTMFHSERVAAYTRDLCEALGLEEELTSIIVMSARLHDIGKISIPDRILQKPSKLTHEEYKIVRTHPVDGATIAASLTRFRKGAVLIRHHHERYDGKGYPDRVKEEEIPIGARIISLLDAFDTMTTPRNYNVTPKTIDEALEEIDKYKGKQFDPAVADAWKIVVNKNREKYQSIIDDARKKIEKWLSQE